MHWIQNNDPTQTLLYHIKNIVHQNHMNKILLPCHNSKNIKSESNLSASNTNCKQT